MLAAAFLCVFVQSTAEFPPASELQTALHPLIEELSTKYECGIAVGFHNAKLNLAWAAGTTDNGTTAASTNDQFVWGSVTKVSTGAAVLQLVGQKKIKLNDPIQPLIDPILSHLISLASKGAYNFTSLADLFGEQVSKVTVAHLLGMKSGIGDYDTVSQQIHLHRRQTRCH
jgi:CubicO group peptidase (beta-lactamase class C family)